MVRVLRLDFHEAVYKHFTMQLFTNQNSILSFFSIFGTFRRSLAQVFELDIHEAVHKHFTMQLFTNQKSILSFFSIFGTFRYSLIEFWDTLRTDKSFHKHFTMQLFANYRSVFQIRIFSRILYIILFLTLLLKNSKVHRSFIKFVPNAKSMIS